MSQNKFDLDEKICIIGAGAAGLSVAYFLKEKGYRNIILLEKEKQVGGKCRTIFYKDRSYELGAALIGFRYRSTWKIIQDLGIETAPFPQQYGILLNNDGTEINYSWKEKLIFLKELFSYLFQVSLKNRGIYQPGLSNVSEEYFDNFDIFCQKNGLLTFASQINLICSAYGYGYFDTIPAAYYIKYLSYASILRNIFDNKNRSILVKGMQEIWKQVANYFDVLYDREIVSVERKEKIYICTQQEKIDANRLILACPLDNTLEFIDRTPLEEKIFSKISYNYYYTFAFIIKEYSFIDRNRVNLGGYIPQNINKESQDKVMCFYRRYVDSDLYMFYAIANREQEEAELKSKIKNQLKAIGFEIDREYTSVKWKYFPHVTSEDLRDGFHQKLEALQGQNNTYLTGEIMNFSCIEGVCEYSQYLVNKYF